MHKGRICPKGLLTLLLNKVCVSPSSFEQKGLLTLYLNKV